MDYSFALEQAYLSKEYSRAAPSRARIVGTLLDSAFRQPANDADFADLLDQLEAPTAH